MGTECVQHADCGITEADMSCQDFAVNANGQCTADCHWFECHYGECIRVHLIALKQYKRDLDEPMGKACKYSSIFRPS